MPQQRVLVFSGTGTGDGTALNPKAGLAQTMTLQVVLTSTGTLSLKSTLDGTTFDTLNVTKQDTGVQYTSITIAGTYEVDVTGRYAVKPNVSANGSGVTLTASLSDGGGGSSGGSGGAGGGDASAANQLTLNTAVGTTASVATPAPYTADNDLIGIEKAILLGIRDTTAVSHVIVDTTALATGAAQDSTLTSGAIRGRVEEAEQVAQSIVNLCIDRFAVAQVADVMIATMASSTDNAAPSTGLNDYTVPAGKEFVIQSIDYNASTTTGNTTRVASFITIRTAVSGAITTASPKQRVLMPLGAANANDQGAPVALAFPKGWILPAASRIGFSCNCPGWVVTVASPLITINVTGFLRPTYT